MNKYTYDIIVVGGGASGFFTAINSAQSLPQKRIAILERGRDVLTKVRISGGGRCNVTHAEFVPKELSLKYPRGKKELLGPFHTFMTGDTISWFEDRGVALKIEEDGRMFPETDSSSTIIDCFLKETQQLGIDVITSCSVQNLESAFAKGSIDTTSSIKLNTTKGDFTCEQLVIATGSNPKIWNLLEGLGHTITAAVPSLFTFNIKDKRIEGLMGLSAEVSITVLNTKLISEGPLLITHWGMSGPAILKLSAWGARELARLDYSFEISVNWLGHSSIRDALEILHDLKLKYARQSPHTHAQLELPKRLWQNILTYSGILAQERWADLTKEQLENLSRELTQARFRVSGKSTFKEEFVTAGGVALDEIDFKTFESKVIPNVYLVGEVLNIDAITGGFNFQNAWTGGFIAAKAIINKSKK